MPLYSYTAKRSPTEITQGVLEARSKEEAVHSLIALGLTPVTVELSLQPAAMTAGDVTEAEWKKEIRHPLTMTARGHELDLFTRQLATLTKANVPILQALALIARQAMRRSFRAVVKDLAEQVRQGRTVSEAMARYPRIFDNLYVSMVLAGERGGVLSQTLLRMAEHRERQRELRRNIQGALAYPLFVIFFGLVTVFFVLTVFLPRVIGLLESLQQQLPVSTLILIAATRYTSQNWYWLLIGGTLAAALLLHNRPGSKKKLVVDFLKLHTPLISRLVRNAEISKFSRTLGLLIENGISVHEGLLLATNTLDNAAVKNKIEQVGADIVNKGRTLSESLNRSQVFPQFAVNMIGVGEQSGELAETLAEVADAYDREVQQTVKLIMSLLEPLLIMLVGGVIGFIVFAMLMPIFNIGGF
jgi:type IV pilus assembly protein PilC